MKYYFSRGWLVTLLILSVLLSGCSSFGPSSSLHNYPSSEATPTPSPEPTERPVFKMSVDEDVINPIDVYPEAVAAMRRCEFEHAAELFQQLGSFSDSAENYKYCLERLAAEEIPENKRYTGIRNRIEDFDGGYLYAISVGYLYVPHVCDENTRCCIYFAGGAGQDYLYREGVYRYLMKYQPNGIILFHYESCVTHWPGGIRNAAKIMRQVEQECNIVLHDMITVGSSSGSFTALHAAALLQEEFNIPVHATLLLDAAMEWDMPTETLLSDEECKLLAEKGTLLCLFEQAEAVDYEEIHRMADFGDKVLVIICESDGHNIISVNAYDYGLFSWGFEEIELDPSEYTVVPIERRS